ncbi:hypothetical protein O1R50_18640 [Glycomyces luteolus]|uniref:Uncharacterized protein n=1 Tax=Glycomyces luteolus TaxID=2670330 RepID=A0A9X3PDA8_9ACTN|nr:hypothetical protein [Glycomyces luteolus]MDA1361652.1 hypothetical protein [Glycomyces luteolus]
MTAVLILLMLAAAVLGLGWYMASRQRSDEFADEAATASGYMDVTVSLPSRDEYFQFTCQFRVAYAPTDKNRAGTEPSISSVESLLYTAGKDVSTNLALPQRSQLRHELSDMFRVQRTLPNKEFVISAYCDAVEVDEGQLRAVERSYDEVLEAERLQRRVGYLGKVFQDPRTATMWWLAQDPAKIDELPGKAELLYRLDRRLNPNANPSDLPISRDLDWFIQTADDSERAAIGVALAGIYRRFGREEFADEAEQLIPKRTLPSRKNSDPENPDDDQNPGRPNE